MNPARILYIINNADIGGGPQHLAYLLRYLDRTRFDTTVMCTGGGLFLDLLKQEQVTVIPVDLMRWYTHPTAVRHLIRIIREERIALVHTHGTRAGLIGGLAARCAGIPSVYTLHASRAIGDNRFPGRWTISVVERVICRLSSLMISVSEVNRRFFIEHGLIDEQHSVAIPNGLPLDEWVAQPSARTRDKPPTIGMIGRVERQKGVLFFIDAAAEIHQHRPDLRFVIIGDGEWRRRARNLVRRLHLTDVVCFTGWIPDTRAAFDMIDIIVLPSLWEGLPFVALEGMALKKPVIATRVNGLSEAIEHGRTGLLIPPKDPHALADAVIELSDNPALAKRFTEAAHIDVRTRFDLSTMVDRTMDVYTHILS